MYGSPQRGVQDFFRKYQVPATITIIAVTVVSFFTTATLQGGNDPFRWLRFSTQAWPSYFWTLVTWPFYTAGMGPLGVLFSCAWTWWVCGSLERSWGTRTFSLFFAATTAITALGVWLGAMLLRGAGAVWGLYVAIAPATIAWCVINRRETICLYGVLRIPAPFLALLTLVLVWYQLGPAMGQPALGLFALVGCAAAYWYATQGRYAYSGYSARRSARPEVTRRHGHLRLEDIERLPDSRRLPAPLRWIRDWQERRRLAKLFGNTDRKMFRDGTDDPDGRRR